ncbi:MAG: DNA replication/repair protein RecF [Limisphaerales bacterium]
MHLTHLRLRDFRNYARLDVPLEPGFHLLVGDNAEGKTNVLEAVYLLATLRSFRGVGAQQLVRHGAKGWFAGADLVATATHALKMYWSPSERRLAVDGRPVRKLAEFYGLLRAVVFCTEDLQLVKGTGRSRRRFLDLILAQTQPGYLALLQRYARALRSRNALLKRPAPDEAVLRGFSRELVEVGEKVLVHRHALLPRLSPLARLAHRRISRDADELRLDYRPGVRGDFAVELEESRGRERTLRVTVTGPHRDDVALLVNERPAAQFGSEGQKRTVALALKVAQAEYLAGVTGTPPILLLDDVMGELDAHRRAGLLPLLGQVHQRRGQVFMTCTEENWPVGLGLDLHRWRVRAGTLERG